MAKPKPAASPAAVEAEVEVPQRKRARMQLEEDPDGWLPLPHPDRMLRTILTGNEEYTAAGQKVRRQLTLVPDGGRKPGADNQRLLGLPMMVRVNKEGLKMARCLDPPHEVALWAYSTGS